MIEQIFRVYCEVKNHPGFLPGSKLTPLKVSGVENKSRVTELLEDLGWLHLEDKDICSFCVGCLGLKKER